MLRGMFDQSFAQKKKKTSQDQYQVRCNAQNRIYSKTKLQCQAVIFARNRTNGQMSTPFLRVRPCNFAHVFNVPLPRLLRMCFFAVFSPKMWGLLRPKYPTKNTKTKIISDGEKKKKNIRLVIGSAGVH